MQPPTGKVTLVFTDMEGSTALWEKHGDDFQAVLARHNDLIREVALRHSGYEVSTEGDAFFLVFARPLDAIRFALETQVAMREVSVGADAVSIRIGMHVGEPLIEFDRAGKADYFGPAVNRAARISAAGHGGQTLLSFITLQAVHENLEDAWELEDLGEHRFKGLDEPERLHQLVPADAEVKKFGVLRYLTEAPNNLPAQTTTFVGRARELKMLRTMLLGDRAKRVGARKPLDSLARDPGAPDTGQVTREVATRDRGARNITLTGPGGCGKTRLALALANDVLTEFAGGVWFVDLADVANPTEMCETVMAALKGQIRPGRGEPEQQVAWLLEHRECLLVLDTFDQLTEFAPVLSLWLRTAPRLKLVVTSREILRVEGEVEFPVEPLPTPDREVIDRATRRLPQRILDYAAVQLFVERASQAKRGFAITPANAAAVAEICRRLDGIPLALELAAARLSMLTPEQLAARLEKGMEIVSGRGRDRSRRQATLNDTIRWSYDQLDSWEKTALLQVAVFEGPFTLESAEEVLVLDRRLEDPAEGEETDECAPEVMDVVFSLRDKSLLSLKSSGDRCLFEMLGTIRRFVRERVGERVGEQDSEALRRRHAEHYCERSSALSTLLDSSMGGSLKEADSWGLPDSMTAAVWAIESGDLALGMKLTLGICRILAAKAKFRDMRDLTNRMVNALVADRGGEDALFADEAIRADLAAVYNLLAQSEHRAGNFEAGVRPAERAVLLANQVGAMEVEASALNILGLSAAGRRDHEKARSYLEASLALRRKIGKPVGEAAALSNLAVIVPQGDTERMRSLAQEAYNIYHRRNDRRGLARATNNLGVAYQRMGDFTRAVALYETSLKIKIDLKDVLGAAHSAANIGTIHYQRLQFQEALVPLRDSLAGMREMGDRMNLALCLETLSRIYTCLGDADEGLLRAKEAVKIRREMTDAHGLQDALSAQAGANRAADPMASRANCEEILSLCKEHPKRCSLTLAHACYAFCTDREESAEHIRKMEAAVTESEEDEIEVLALCLKARLEADSARARLMREQALDRGYFDTKAADILFCAKQELG